MKKRGFTLLEMLVATVIMGIAVVGLLSNISTSLRNAARLTDHDRIAVLAEKTMSELLMEPDLPEHTVVEGEFDPTLMGGVEGGWRARLEPFEIPPQAGPGSAVLDRLELEVWWMSGSQRRTFTMESFRRSFLRREDVPQGTVNP